MLLTPVGHDQRRQGDIQHVHRRCEVSEETRKLWRRQADLDCRHARAAAAATPIDSVGACFVLLYGLVAQAHR